MIAMLLTFGGILTVGAFALGFVAGTRYMIRGGL